MIFHVVYYVQPEHLAASIARLREEGVLSLSSTQPTTPSTTPAYPPYQPGTLCAHIHSAGDSFADYTTKVTMTLQTSMLRSLMQPAYER